MKGCRQFLAIVFLALGLIAFNPKAQAQGLSLSASVSASSIQISNSLTYTILVTNVNPAVTIFNVAITNTFFTSISNAPLALSFFPTNGAFVNGAIVTVGTNSPNDLIFLFSQLGPGISAPVTVTVQPNFVGSLSNQIDVGTTSGGFTNLSTNFVTQVTAATNPVVIPTDLTVAFTPPIDDVFVNDQITYTLTVSNLSSTSANNVFLTNTLPPGVTFKVASPAQQSFSSSKLRFNLGNLTNQASRTVHVTVQVPGNAGTNTFSAAVGAAGITDTNNANNTATMLIPVSDFSTNQLVAFLNDPTQTFNIQVSLLEQGIIVSNASSTNVLSSRVMVSGIPSKGILQNAVGTNNGIPFVVHGAPLAPGESVGLLLQFRVPSNDPFPLDDSNLDAREVTGFNLTPPANPGTPAARQIITVPGRMLLKFPSTNGLTYTIVYSDALGMNRRVARPPVTASANVTYWFDYGPPETVSAPMGAGSRFYEVFLSPP